MSSTSWYEIERNATGPDEILIYGEIGGFGVDAAVFAKDLNELHDVRVRINSNGGFVDTGIAIYEALNDHPYDVETKVDAAAYSIASVIAQAGRPGKRTMAPRSRMLIHEASAITGGRASDFRRTADELEKTTAMIAGVYAERSGKAASHWLGLMADETRFAADEAVQEGLADRVTGRADKRAFHDASMLDMSRFRNCADIKAELEAVAAEIASGEYTPELIENAVAEGIRKGVSEAVAAIQASVERNRIDPSDAARRELEDAIARVKL